MLKPEVAREQLKQFRVPKGDRRREAAVAALPEGPRSVAWGLQGRTPDGKRIKDWSRRHEVETAAVAQLAGLPPGDRRALFEALAPGLGGAIDLGWQLHDRLPYEAGWEPLPFRAPGAQEIPRPAREQWLTSLLGVVEEYDRPVAWYAAWAPYLGYHSDPLGTLLAGAIDGGGAEGEEVFETLLASARGDHPVGAMGKHVVTGLLCSARPEGWEFVEKLLLAAQRQEGLRQSILEGVPAAHPEAFRRMLRLILDHDLLRFSSVLQAVHEWFGTAAGGLDGRAAKALVAQVGEFLETPAKRQAALTGGDGETTYRALWVTACEDAPAAARRAAELLHDPDAERRFAAVRLLGELHLPEAERARLAALDDPELRVALLAFHEFERIAAAAPEVTDLFERVERLLARYGPKDLPKASVGPADDDRLAGRSDVADALVELLGHRPVQRLLAHLPAMSETGRREVAERLGKLRKPDAEARAALLALAGDRSSWVRDAAFEAIGRRKVDAEELPRLEALLSRKTAEVRQHVLDRLAKQKDPAALASADRLLAAGETMQRQAGLELLRRLLDAGRAAEEVRARAGAYRETRARRTQAEETLLEGLLAAPETPVTLADALGLMDPAGRTPPASPREVPGIALESAAARELVQSLDDRIHRHRETPVRYRAWEDEEEEEELLGEVEWGFPDPKASLSAEADAARLPLREFWERWWNERPAETRDADGFELLRALVNPQGLPKKKLRYEGLVASILQWMLRLHPPAGAAEFLSDAIETSFARVPRKLVEKKLRHAWDPGWRGEEQYTGWLTLARQHRQFCPAAWDVHEARWWGLLRWHDEPAPGARRSRPEVSEAVAAFRAGAATEHDLIDMLLGPRGVPEDDDEDDGGDFSELRALTRRRGSRLLKECPALAAVVERCRARILDVELARGDRATAATAPALALGHAGGAATLVRLLEAMGDTAFHRGWSYGETDRATAFSTLVKATHPEEADPPDALAVAVRGGRIPEPRWVEVAFYAPQWATHVGTALGWPQFDDALWWFYAHARDASWREDEEDDEDEDEEGETEAPGDPWAARIAEHTPLPTERLADGAVDVAWFHRVYQAVGPERWSLLDRAAKYVTGGSGYKRAQLFANAMLGRLAKDEILPRILNKRHQDSLRALGLLPLPPDPNAAEAEVLARYEVVQEFLRGSRQFGSMRRQNEKLAASIALENLARTAGYADPVRLEWAMEARAIADLAEGPLTAQAGPVQVTLAINEWGESQLTVTKAGRSLKNLPPAAKKDPAVAALVERRREVGKQASRMRQSLEAAMCRGDRFSGAELPQLMRHPVLSPMLRNLVFLGEGKAGYPVEGGSALEAHDDRRSPVAEAEPLRLAHPHDLLGTGEWHLWQRDCFRRERIQPFKQVFRELYVLTQGEREQGTRSGRYAGHQVNPRQSRALLGTRGWVSDYDEGEMRRTFHDEGLTAWLEIDYGWTTPAEVEGLTIEHVSFRRRGGWEPLNLEEVPPRLFSEVMRDVDLIVSVAHQGGVDPEATASTVEMRAALLRETCALLKLDNVRFSEASRPAKGSRSDAGRPSHALIDGQLGTYSVHLGSAVVHRQPGGHLCIVPVHSQHRGRVFLPFADDDPKTAEVVSKVLLLAKDHEIKDPIILEQLLPP